MPAQKQLNILYIANIRLPTEKAHGVQIMKMCEAFAALGHDVTLLVSARRTLAADPFKYYGVAKTFAVRRAFSLDWVRFGKLGFVAQTSTFILAAARAARGNYDLVYTRDPGVVWLLGLMGVRAAWEMHVASDGWLARRAAAHARAIVVISQGLADYYAARGVPRDRILVAHDGIDLAEFAGLPPRAAARTQLGLPQDRRLVAYVGKFTTMGQSKGVEAIIDAAGVVARTRAETSLLIVGLQDSERPAAEARAAQAGLRAEQRIFVGHVPRAGVPAYLRAADVLVMNYPNQPHYARMMSPLKLFEYMGSGTPIVSSDLPSIREVLSPESSVLVAPDDVAALAEGIERVLADPAAGERMAAKARQEVAHYTWSARAKDILAHTDFS